LGLVNPNAQQYSRHAQGAEPRQNALTHPHPDSSHEGASLALGQQP
jgi:hypothetical protein